MMMKKYYFSLPGLLLLLVFFSPIKVSANNLNWNKVKADTIPLFYPGQSAWEWLLTKHSAAKSVRKGAACLECHEDEEAEMGALLVSGKKLEPTPIKGKPGLVEATLQLTQDAEYLYFRVSWNDPQFVSGKKQDEKFDSKVAVMIGNQQVREFPVAACWGACHNDATEMPDHKSKQARSLYTSASRNKITRSGGGDNFVAKEKLQTMRKNGDFIEYWQTRIKNPKTHENISGYILEKRQQSSSSNVDATVENHSGHWQVTFKRPLKSNHQDALNLKASEVYTFGIAIHDDYTKGRFHYVSFPRTFSLTNNQANIVAEKQ